MKAKIITESEMQPLRIASLPTRPTAPTYLGGKGFTATEMKEAFDRLPNLIAERYNDLITDIESGDLLDILKFDGKPLREFLNSVKSDINYLKKK